MAAYVQDVVTFDTNAGNKVATITPAVNGLLVVFFAESSNITVGSVADDQGGTYTTINSYQRAGGGSYGAVAVRDALISSSVATAVTMTAGGVNAGGGLNVIEVSGMTAAGASAVRQSAVQTNSPATGNPATGFASTTLSTNMILGMLTNASNPPAVTEPLYMTSRQAVAFNTPTSGLLSWTTNSGFVGKMMTYGTPSVTAYGDVAVELAVPAAAMKVAWFTA